MARLDGQRVQGYYILHSAISVISLICNKLIHDSVYFCSHSFISIRIGNFFSVVALSLEGHFSNGPIKSAQAQHRAPVGPIISVPDAARVNTGYMLTKYKIQHMTHNIMI